MVFCTNIWAILLILNICILHITSAAVSAELSKILSYVNIALHIPLAVLLLLLDAELSELVVIFMGSLLIGLLSALVADKIRANLKKSGELYTAKSTEDEP